MRQLHTFTLVTASVIAVLAECYFARCKDATPMHDKELKGYDLAIRCWKKWVAPAATTKQINLVMPRGREKTLATKPPYSRQLWREQFKSINSEAAFAEAMKTSLFKLANHMEDNGGPLLEYCACGAPMVCQMANMTHANR